MNVFSMRFSLCKMMMNNIQLHTTDDLSYCQEAKIISLKVNNNFSTTTFTRLIVRVILKTAYIVFLSAANFISFSLATVYFSFPLIIVFVPYYIQPTYCYENQKW